MKEWIEKWRQLACSENWGKPSWDNQDILNLVAEIKCLEARYATLNENYEELMKQYEKECDRREKAEATLSSLRSLVAMPKVLQLVAIKKKARRAVERYYDCPMPLVAIPLMQKEMEELRRLIAEYDKGQDNAPKHELDWPNDSCCFYREK